MLTVELILHYIDLPFAHLGYLQQQLEECEELKSPDQNQSPKKVEHVKVRIYPNTTIHLNSFAS
jgi:hypothetical protein